MTDILLSVGLLICIVMNITLFMMITEVSNDVKELRRKNITMRVVENEWWQETE